MKPRWSNYNSWNLYEITEFLYTLLASYSWTIIISLFYHLQVVGFLIRVVLVRNKKQSSLQCSNMKVPASINFIIKRLVRENESLKRKTNSKIKYKRNCEYAVIRHEKVTSLHFFKTEKEKRKKKESECWKYNSNSKF